MANMVVLPRGAGGEAGWDVREQGMAGGRGPAASRLRVEPKRTRGCRRRPTSPGLGTDAIRWIPADGDAADGRRRAARRSRRIVAAGRRAASWSSARPVR